MELTLQVLLSVLTALVSLAIAALAWQHREVKGVPELVLFNVGVFVWTAGNAAQHASTTLEWKLLWVNVQYVGVVIVPLTVYGFACQFTDNERWARGWRLGAVAAPLVVLLVLSWTNPLHGLVRAIEAIEVTTRPDVIAGSATIIDRTEAWGPAFWVGWLYSQILVVASTLVLFRHVLYAQDIFQRQTVAIVLGAIVPWVGHMLFITGVTMIEPVVFFGVTGAAFVYAVLRYQMLDLLPVARDAVLEMMTEGVIVVDANGRIVDVNRAATDILGRDATAIVGENVDDAFDAFPQLQACYEAQVDTDEVALDRGGTTRYFDVNVSDLPKRQGGGTAIVLHDITPIRDRERDLERQNEQLEIVAETLSHDLRNPINVATGFLDQARRTGDDDAFDRVENAHERMEDIIEDVLTLARHDETVDPEPVSLGAAATEAWEHVETADASHVLETDGRIEAEYGQLLTLFENLYRNAVEHGGGDVTVRVGLTEEGFYVADDGVGIPEEKREEVFEHGYTGGSGTGFGLAIVERVAEAHGWTIAVTESDDGGARFDVSGVTVIEQEAERPEPGIDA